MPEVDTTSLLNDPRADYGTVAIDAGTSVEDFRDSAEFEALEADFRKTETEGPSAVDWKSYNARSLEVIKTQSKDLVLGTRLAYGLYLDEGYTGLGVGLSILRGMVSEHWEELFPPVKRERGRVGAFDWLAEKLAPAVEAKPPSNDALVYALVSHEMLTQLDDLLEQKLSKYSVAMGPLVRALRPHAKAAQQVLDAAAEAEKQAEAPQSTTAPEADGQKEPLATREAEAPAPQPAQVVQPAPQPAPAAAPVELPAIPADGNADASAQAIFNAASKVATSIRQQSPADSRAYLCARFAIWGRIQAAPPSSAGKTSLPPPQKAKIAEIEALLSAGNNEALVKAAESGFVASPFWLDAQYHVAKAMQSLGADYDAANRTVTAELASFLKRVPGLVELSFNSGMSFASPETRSWIQELTKAPDGAGGGGVSELDLITSAANAEGQSGRVQGGLQILSDHANSRASERERFLSQIKMGEYCLRFELLAPVFALISRLRETSEKRALDMWEPELAVELAKLSWRCLSHKNARQFINEGHGIEMKAEIMGTLAALNLPVAAELSGKK
ncbi:type VI secretion system protein TssA [Roseibium polysiphoniae]|uniref:Type VI secretion system protein TssA n=1 Tax=Roseibium polysiphoniae TaxID=2571221 RepID=A0A944CIX4_9HYPH|nr:type VI secretion system protein TssA [Roseibium polysiphoniae]MBS8262593.1 type VI secretion system protein TssA [Roseibium polysiphoniae]